MTQVLRYCIDSYPHIVIQHILMMYFYVSPSQRSIEDVEVIYEELLHVKAVAHLSSFVSDNFKYSFPLPL